MYQHFDGQVIGRRVTSVWRPYMVATTILVFVLFAVAMFSHRPTPVVAPAPTESVRYDAPTEDLIVYMVRRGDTLASIAERHHVSWQVLWELNREVLLFNAEDHCRAFDEDYTQNELRRGRFCNQLFVDERGSELVSVNTLKAGDMLVVPQR